MIHICTANEARILLQETHTKNHRKAQAGKPSCNVIIIVTGRVFSLPPSSHRAQTYSSRSCYGGYYQSLTGACLESLPP